MTAVRVGGGASVSTQGTLRPSGKYVGTFNPATGLPTTGSGANGAILKGDFWKSSGSGTITGLLPFEGFVANDLLYSNINNPQSASDFFGNKSSGVGATSGNGTTVESNAVNLGGVQNDDIVILPDGSLTRVFQIGDDEAYGSQDLRAILLLYGELNIYGGGLAVTFIEGLISQAVGGVGGDSALSIGSESTFSYARETSQTYTSYYLLDRNRAIIGRSTDPANPTDGNRIEINDTGIGFFGATPIEQPTLTESNVTETRTLDANNASLNDLRNFVGTLVSDLKRYGLFV